MLGSKGILTPMIPDCSVLRTLTILVINIFYNAVKKMGGILCIMI